MAPTTSARSANPAASALPTVKEALNHVFAWAKANKGATLLCLGLIAVIAYFYGFFPRFFFTHQESAFSMMKGQWTTKVGWEHGWLGPPILIGLLLWRLPALVKAEYNPSRWGLVLVLLGVLFFLMAVRTYQDRIANFGFVFLLWGIVLYGHGKAAFKLLFFPIAIFWFMISLPGLLQATNGLQVFSTKMAFKLVSLIGIKCEYGGTQIMAIPRDKWSFEIDEGCSGIRSLVALTMISAVYALVTQKVLWKGIVLFLSSIPLAIFGNSLRIASIVVIAEWIDKGLANFWHDNGGLFFFAVVGLVGLMALDSLINRKKRKLVVARKAELESATNPTPNL